ncbi:M36 family metallopeptidase [uncultured Lacinutrix sp.]|uniref:M36 family metallopeptidase n=1 Tax=uncultured Lacinutrix sp. TaxID=574032 RepID=UPI0026108BA9|nr:M36 family metallopeptidase [uncultured Lacinutrix sp.]
MKKKYFLYESKLKTIFAFAFILVYINQISAQNKKIELKPSASTVVSKKAAKTVKKKVEANKEAITRINAPGFLEDLLKSSDKSKYVITSEHVSSISGIHHSYIRQAINGVEVMGTESSLHIDRHGKTLVTHNKFIKDINNTVQSSSRNISAEQAIKSVSQIMGYGEVVGLKEITSRNDIEQTEYQNRVTLYNKGGISNTDIPVKEIYYYEESIGTKLVWELSIEDKNSSDWYNFIVDASTGEILTKHNFTVSCNVNGDHSNHNHNKTINNKEHKSNKTTFNLSKTSAAFVGGGSYNVYALPVESPGHGNRSIVTDPADATASPYGWHDTDGAAGAESNYTIGNNCDAYDDSSSTVTGTGDGTNAERANGGATLNFDFTIDTNVNNNSGSIDAAVTNLFYWTNVIHDVWYLYGFDEASGNFQVNNYGNGGVAGDSVRAEAQDGSGTCNANFATPADGGRGRMQMYVCGTRDGDLDNVVVAHEYGHGISTRLTGGAGNSGCLNNDEQMGEGWSDFIGLVMTIEPGDLASDQRGVGTWLVGQGPNGAGIRPQPYSVTNTQSYADLGGEAIPHGVGSIWSSILWKLNWALIDVYGWDSDVYYGTGGNNICMRLVIEGMKLQPCSPGFVDGRDAILAADAAIYGGANTDTIWQVFAGAGVGEGAAQGTNNNNNTTSTTAPAPSVPTVAFSTTTGTQVEGSDCTYTDVTVPLIIGVGASATATATFSVTGTTGTDGVDFQLMTTDATFAAGVTGSQDVTIRVYNDDFIEGDETMTIGFTLNANGGDAIAGASSYTLTITDDDFDPLVSGPSITVFSDDFESGLGQWTVTGNGTSNFAITNNAGFPDAGFFNSDQSNTTNYAFINDDDCNCTMDAERIASNGVALIGGVEYTISFDYAFDNQYATDTARIELSSDGGATWPIGADLAKTATATGQAAASAVPFTTINFTYTPVADETTIFSFLYGDAGGWGQGIILDNFNVSEPGPIAIQTALNTTTTNNVSLPSAGLVYAYDDTTGNLITNYNNVNGFDYGCVDTSISREGVSTQSYNGSVSPAFVSDKVFTIKPTNTTTNTATDVTFYFTAAEIAGLESLAGVSRSNLFAYRTGSNEIIALTDGVYGTDIGLTGTFTGLDGTYYFGPEDAFRVRVSPKVVLQGAALNPNTGEESLMRDDLRTAFPLALTSSPYSDGLTCDASVFNVTGSDAIVDWVFVELRDATTNTTVVASQSALLQRDGDVVGADGTSALTFNIPSNNYYVVIKHRNHLGIMSASTILLDATTRTVDFTNGTTTTFGTDAQTTFGMQPGISAMWAGDTNGDGQLNYSGALSDVPGIRSQVFNDPNNSVFGGPPVASYQSQGYYGTDVDMDGLTVYSGGTSDVSHIRNNIFNNPSNSVFGGPPTSTYLFVQQLPEGAN